MAAASTNGMTALATMDSGLKIKLRDWECTLGWMVDSTKANGWTIICMDLEYTPGKMAEFMKENIRTTKNMDLAFTPGLTVDATVDIGGEANNMVLELT